MTGETLPLFPDEPVQSFQGKLAAVEKKNAARIVCGNGIANGKFYLFGENGIFVVRFWPAPAAWHKKLRNGKWRGLRPALDLGARTIGLPRREPHITSWRWVEPVSPGSPRNETYTPRSSKDPAIIERRKRGFDAVSREVEWPL